MPKNMKGRVRMYMRVTEDEFSLPIVTADTSRELALKCDVQDNTIRHNISMHQTGKVSGYPKYVRVVIDEEDWMDKLKIARRHMAKIPVIYEQLMRMHPDGIPSLGMVTKYDRVGGRGSGGGSITESVAMKNLAITDAQREMLRWLDATYNVYFRLMDRTGKSAIKAQHDRKLAAVLEGRIYKGENIETIRDKHFRAQTCVQYVSKLYSDIVEQVAEEAEKMGLYRAYEGA